jgi:hypothetical protein
MLASEPLHIEELFGLPARVSTDPLLKGFQVSTVPAFLSTVRRSVVSGICTVELHGRFSVEGIRHLRSPGIL